MWFCSNHHFKLKYCRQFLWLQLEKALSLALKDKIESIVQHSVLLFFAGDTFAMLCLLFLNLHLLLQVFD